MIADYPEFSSVTVEMREVLHGRFKELSEGISEFTFAGIYLFREAHQYRISALGEGLYIISGEDRESFFMLPFGLPEKAALDEMFGRFGQMKCASESQAGVLEGLGYRVWEDRDNFDYLYGRQELVELKGRKLHSKKNLVNKFMRENNCDARPLLEEYTGDAMRILERWRGDAGDEGDYAAAREALERMELLQLCGGIVYVEEEPVAYCLGEEVMAGRSFVIHFEKAVRGEQYKGVYQYLSRIFSSVLPEKYEYINREQDLGDPGLRRAKGSYNPVGFVKKYRVSR